MRPTVLYGPEFWMVNKKIEQRMNVAEMRILKWTSEVTGEDGIRNEK